MFSYLSSYIWTAENEETTTAAVDENPMEDVAFDKPNPERCSAEATWVLVNRDGASSPQPEAAEGGGDLEDEQQGSTGDSRRSSIRESSYHPSECPLGGTCDTTTTSVPCNLPPNCPSVHVDSQGPSQMSLDNATSSLADIDTDTILEASYVENCLLELSVSHTEDVRDYLENSQPDVRTLVSHRKKPKRYQVRPSSLQAALQVQQDPKFEAAKMDQKAKLRSKTERKVNSKSALRRHNMERYDSVKTNKNKNFNQVKNRLINQCASRSTCH